MLAITREVTEGLLMRQRKFQRFQRLVKANDLDLNRQIAQSTDHSQGIRGSAQANVPNDERPLVVARSLGQRELFDVKGFCFGDRPYDGMKRFVAEGRAYAVGAARKLNDAIRSRFRHGAF